MNYFGENVRFLLWKTDKRSGKSDTAGDFTERLNRWSITLAGWMGTDRDRAKRALISDIYFKEEKINILRHLRYAHANPDVLDKDRLAGAVGKDIFRLNMCYLLDGMPRGVQKDMCAELDVNCSTIYRRKVEIVPHKAPRQAVCRYFGLPIEVELTCDPVFLSVEPLGTQVRRNWMKDRIDAMPDHQLIEFFPALRRMVEG